MLLYLFHKVADPGTLIVAITGTRHLRDYHALNFGTYKPTGTTKRGYNVWRKATSGKGGIL